MAEVSIIIPTFNRAHFLGETLDSISAQTFRDWECIVVDDGSSDYTEELMNFYAEKDQRFKFYSRPKRLNEGANACRNFGFPKSSGNYILWYDSDDLMKAEKLEIQLRTLKNSNSDFCVAHSEIFNDSSGKILGLRFEQLSSDNLMLDYAMMKIGWMTPAVLWKKRFLNNLNTLFDEELQAAQEWEFHLRVIAQNPRFSIIEKSQDLIRQHGNSITYSIDNPEREWYYFLARLRIYRNRDVHLGKETKYYLKNYLWSHFKKIVRVRSKFSFKAYRMFVWKERELNLWSKFNAFLALLSFKYFGKGNLFLQKIRY